MTLRKIFCSLFLLLFPVFLFAQNFAVIGDFGIHNSAELDVSELVKSWKPDFIITTGDNNYPLGDSTTIDENIGQYYCEYIFPYKGIYGKGSKENRFFPCLGNHDQYTLKGKPYLDYFTLPGNERYYDFVKGDIHFFVLNSEPVEVDGVSSTSVQGEWLKNALSTSTAKWKIVYFHHPPYTSSMHANSSHMQWPFKEWGATAIISGHDHTYERCFKDSLVYFVNGLGGNAKYAFDNKVIPESQFQYNENYGAMKVTATKESIIFKFINTSEETIDTYTINANDKK